MSAISGNHPVVVALVRERDEAKAQAVGQQKRAQRVGRERQRLSDILGLIAAEGQQRGADWCARQAQQALANSEG